MKFFLFFAGAVVLLLLGCGYSDTGDIQAVKSFDIKRYCGTWYEIARLPNWFEMNLSEVLAHYSLRPDGMVNVVNRGCCKGKWRAVNGIARFADSSECGELEVSFQWPFWGKYRIICLDDNYSVAAVCGKSFDYLWILARTPEIPPEKLDFILESLKIQGFCTEKLEFPQQKSGSTISDTAAAKHDSAN